MSSVFVFVLLAKLAGAAKELVLAKAFGVGPVVDAYVLGFTLYHWLPSLWFGVISTVLVPLSAHWLRSNPGAYRRFGDELLGLSLWFGLLATALGAAALAWLNARGALGLSGDAAAQLGAYVWQLAPVLALGLPIGLLSLRLMAHERHANTLYEGIPALTLLAVLLAAPNPGPALLAWGTVAGLALQLLILALTLRGPERLRLPRIGFDSPMWAVFMRGIGIVLAGEFLLSLTTMVDQLMAARLQTGALSSLGYASRLVALALGLMTTVASRSVLPVFAARVANGQPAEAIRHARLWAASLFGIGWAVVGLGLMLAPWGVALVFERGAFTAADTETVTTLVRLGLIQLPFYVAGTVLAQLLASLDRLPAIAWVAAMNLLVKIAANLLLVPIFGAGGLLLGSAVMYAGSAGVFWWLCRPKVIA